MNLVINSERFDGPVIFFGRTFVIDDIGAFTPTNCADFYISGSF